MKQRKSRQSSGAYARLRALAPDVADHYEALASHTRESGPLDAATVALVKVAVSVGLGSWRSVHAHARKALEVGVTPEALRHAVVAALPTVGLPATLDALRWIDESIDERETAATSRRR
jgi:alkylhydroperoxidase/carboxymuconolactone decarboxylase family protein YurZ